MTTRLTATMAVLLLALAAWPSLAQESGARPPAQGIDPLDPAAGDFLDTDLDSLGRRALEAYQAGDYENAARSYLVLLRRNITDEAAVYNLACCFGLMGEPELASRYLVRAFRAGFDDVGHVRLDPDFELVRGKDVFDRVVDSIARARERRDEAAGLQVLIPTRVHLKCRVLLPDSYSPDTAWPLVVGLHGYGSNPEQFARLWQRFGTEPRFIYACPQAPYAMAGRELGYDWMTWVAGDSELTARVRAGTEQYVLDVVRGLQERYRVNEVYLLGFSQGSMFAYTTGIRHSNLFAGLICLGGWLDTDWLSEDQLEDGKGLKVFIGHGTDDRVVEFESGTRARDILAGHGYDVTFYEFEGGHRVPEDAARAAAAWLLNPRSSE